jgi:hypothetical protein
LSLRGIISTCADGTPREALPGAGGIDGLQHQLNDFRQPGRARSGRVHDGLGLRGTGSTGLHVIRSWLGTADNPRPLGRPAPEFESDGFGLATSRTTCAVVTSRIRMRRSCGRCDCGGRSSGSLSPCPLSSAPRPAPCALACPARSGVTVLGWFRRARSSSRRSADRDSTDQLWSTSAQPIGHGGDPRHAGDTCCCTSSCGGGRLFDRMERAVEATSDALRRRSDNWHLDRPGAVAHAEHAGLAAGRAPAQSPARRAARRVSPETSATSRVGASLQPLNVGDGRRWRAGSRQVRSATRASASSPGSALAVRGRARNRRFGDERSR